jgi:glycosyltransferase involved in cell wall biosynthesis
MDSAVHDGPRTPLVSLLLIAYNQEDTVAAAIEGALAQTYSPLEIIISDDASTDRTFAIAEQCVAAYSGPHTVRLNRNQPNLGISAHLSRLAATSTGALLFVAAGDDISMPDRCRKVVDAWLASGRQADLIATDLYDLDAEGNVHDVLHVTDLSQYRSFGDWANNRPHVVGAAHTWSRRLFDVFGGMEPGIYGEDQIMTFRAITQGGALTLREPLVKYRRGGLSRKRRWKTPEEFVARFKLANRNGLGETRQLIHDAEIAGVGDKMRALLAPKLAREQYTAAMFGTSALGTKLALLLKSRDVSLGFRLRVFLYATCPSFYKPFFFLKWHVRR